MPSMKASVIVGAVNRASGPLGAIVGSVAPTRAERKRLRKQRGEIERMHDPRVALAGSGTVLAAPGATTSGVRSQLAGATGETASLSVEMRKAVSAENLWPDNAYQGARETSESSTTVTRLRNACPVGYSARPCRVDVRFD